jgi:Hydrazine synthase alpha subunit middle domain
VAQRSILACVVLLLAVGTGKSSVEIPSTPASFLYTVARMYEPLAWMQSGERFPSGATIFVRESSGKQIGSFGWDEQRPLLPDFAATADPAVSVDGERVLFAGKRKVEDPWQVWELSLSTLQPRQITSGKDDCIRPFYLPDDRIVYAHKTEGRFRIEAADRTGHNALVLTYGPANFLPSDILRDGRILFEAGYPLGSDATPEIYTVYSDGSGMESYRCDHSKAHQAGKQISSGDIIFVSASGLSRFTSARAKDVAIAAPAGEYAGDIAELPSGDWLLPWRANSQNKFQLVSWNRVSGTLHNVAVAVNADAIQPVILGPRAVPNRHPSGLHDWANANLLCLNAYTSKYSFATGSIHSVRMYERDAAGSAKLLGTAPVEKDGSFFVQVATEQALQIELLDASGKTLQRESGFFWMRRGEQRVCVGCHAGPETAPENAVPKILLRSTTPADMTSASSANASGGH